MDRPKFKILRSPSLKRKQRVVPIAERVKLERVLGLTIASNAALSVDRNTGTIAYPAGCVVVLYNPKKGKQTHIFSASKKTLTCLAFSHDGKHLVTGESGHQPAVRVWSLEDQIQVAEFVGHKFGVSCVAFSPNLKYVVSIGTQHDMIVNVWNWKTNIKVASNKVASKVTGVAFSEDGSMFVTVGNRHVKFWYLDASKSKIKTETLPLQGRNGILGEHQNNFFCGVCCGKGRAANYVYAITESGLLCEFDHKRLLVKWVSLRTERAYAICLGEQHIFIGCAGGLVRVFDAETLNFLATLPRPHHLGVDVSVSLPENGVMSPDNSRFPDTIAVQYDDVNNRLTCVYNDHSLYVWDVTDVQKVAKTRSFLFHSGAVWGVDVYPEAGSFASILPSGSFVTSSSDNTIRIWNCSPNMPTDTQYKRNIYCNELLKVVYIDPDLNNLLDIAYNPAGKTDKTDTTFQEKIGIRSVRFSPDGKHLASGDRAGNIRVHDLSTMHQIACIEAHDSEVLCLEYTQLSTGVNLLATASRDRLLHVFDVEHTYGLVQTLDDHSSAITAIKFVQVDGQLLMLSCGADKSLLFRNAQMDPEFRFVLNRHLVSRTTLYDMEIDISGKFVATACQDRNIRIYNTRTGKQKKCYSGSSGTEGTLLRVELDPSGRYAATSCSDKNLSVYDFFAGELVASMSGHSEISPGIKFLNDLKHVVSVSVDGCIFIWRLPTEFTESMMGQTSEELTSAESQNNNPQVRRETFLVSRTESNDFPDANRNFSSPGSSNPLSPASSDSSGQLYRFSVGQLPAWAKPRVQPGSYEKPSTPTNAPSNIALPRGKWARDVEGDPATIKPFFNFLNEDNRIFDLPPSLTMPGKVPIVNDDELNQDDEVTEDEFSPSKAHQNFSNPFRTDLKVEREVSDNSSNSVEDEDEGETIETPYYMPNTIVDSDSTTADSTFMVQENNIRNIKASQVGEGNELISAGEEEDVEQRPTSPTESNKESDIVSLDEQAKMEEGENFETFYQCNETFEETLKKMENEITARFESLAQPSIANRHSISSRFFDKSHKSSTLPGQLQNPPQSPMSKEFSLRFTDEGKRNLNEMRDSKFKDSAGVTRRQGRSFGGEQKSAVKQDAKGDSVPYATLPKTKGKPGRQSADSAVISSAGIVQKPVQSGSSQSLPFEPDSSASQQKRKSSGRVQSYRMQTESSMAKLNAAESNQTRAPARRSAPPLPQNSKYQSTPNLSDAGEIIGENDVGLVAGDIKAVKDRILTITKSRQFSPVLEIDNEAKPKPVLSGFSDSNSRDLSAMLPTSAPNGTLDQNANRELMPPPSTTDVPTSIHSAFLMKANKHRRSATPEMPLLHSKNVIVEKDLVLMEPVQDVNFAELENFDDLPVRDSGDPGNRSNVKLPPTTVTAKSTLNLGRLTSSSVQKSASATEPSTDVTEHRPDVVSSPKIVHISRCASPSRPYSAGSSDTHSALASRRVLPADPQSSDSITDETTCGRSAFLGSDTTTLLTFRPEVSVAADYTAGEMVSPRPSSAGNQSTNSSSYSQAKSGGITLGRSSPFKMVLSSPEVDSKSAWMMKAQQMQQQWEQRHQKKEPGSLLARPSSAVATESEREYEKLGTKEFGRQSSADKNSFKISEGAVSREQWGQAKRTRQEVLHSKQLTDFSSYNIDRNIPKEGEPDTAGKLDFGSPRAPEIVNISSNGIKDAAMSSSLILDSHDDTEKRCARVASELTEAVSRAQQMYTQLSSDSSYDDMTNGHDRALKLLRETICEAKDQLTKTIDSKSTLTADEQNLATDERMFEMLENYSQKLYDLFKKKLEND